MIGHNEIRLNAATVMAALQHYFNTVLFVEGHAPTVSAFAQDNKSAGYGSDAWFVASVRSELEGSK